MTLRECIKQNFEPVNKEKLEEIVNWICHAWGCNADYELTEKEVIDVCDTHYESNEDDMFNWIHDGENESPVEIRNAKWITELDNVLIVSNGGCYFWYHINNALCSVHGSRIRDAL